MRRRGPRMSNSMASQMMARQHNTVRRPSTPCVRTCRDKTVVTVVTRLQNRPQALCTKAFICNHMSDIQWLQRGYGGYRSHLVTTCNHDFSQQWLQQNPVTARVSGRCNRVTAVTSRFLYTHVREADRDHIFARAVQRRGRGAPLAKWMLGHQESSPRWLADVSVRDSQRDDHGDTTP